MTHHDGDMPQFIPEAVPIGAVHVSFDNQEKYDEWLGMFWGMNVAEDLITFEDDGNLHVCIRASGNTLVRLPLSIFMQVAAIVGTHYAPVTEGTAT